MVKIGDKVYNWRYGELTVTKLDGRYIYTSIVDKNGIVGPDAIAEGYFKLPEIVFRLDSLGHWVHSTPEGALLENNNESPFVQKQFDDQFRLRKVMFFPIDGRFLHRFFGSYIDGYPVLEKTLADYEFKISCIPGEYKKLKNEYKETFNKLYEIELSKVLERIIASSPSEKELKVLEDLSANIPKYGLKDCIPNLISKAKGGFANDAAYKEYTLLVEKAAAKLKIYEDEFNTLKDTLKKIKKSPPINDLIDVQHFGTLDLNLLDEIAHVLDEDMKGEKREWEGKKREIQALVEKYKRLGDRSYITDVV